MFILLKTGAMLNLFWLQDCFQGKHEKNIVIFYLVNGVKLIEEYDNETLASDRVVEIRGFMESAMPKMKLEVVTELPTTDINPNAIYLVPSSSEETDMFKEYIYSNGKWELIGIQKSDLSNIYTKEEINALISWNEY